MTDLRTRALEAVDAFDADLASIFQDGLYEVGYEAWGEANKGRHPTGSNDWMREFIEAFIVLAQKKAVKP